MKLSRRRVTVLGAGRSGRAAMHFLLKKGASVFLSESKAPMGETLPKGVRAEFGGHTAQALEADLIIPSPGISGHSPLLVKAKRLQIPVISELSLGYAFLPSKHLVAITGTNGKTTTTTLVGFLLKSHYPSTLMGGNIGTPLCELVPRIRSSTRVVLEVSSYQLEFTPHFKPKVSVLLNITPDHLDHHGSMKAYIAAKAKLLQDQRKPDVLVANWDDPIVRKLAKQSKARVLFFSTEAALESGIWYQDGAITLQWGPYNAQWSLHWNLPGMHNVQNALASIAAALCMGVPLSKIQRKLRTFKGVEHRLEFVRLRHGVRYVNDSKATNVDSTRVALQAIENPLIVIMGGQGKGSPYQPLVPLMKNHVECLLLIGEDAARIAAEVGDEIPCEIVQTMERAVQRASEIAHDGSVVLLSPACASFDQYTNYEQRGAHFKQCVQGLA